MMRALNQGPVHLLLLQGNILEVVIVMQHFQTFLRSCSNFKWNRIRNEFSLCSPKRDMKKRRHCTSVTSFFNFLKGIIFANIHHHDENLSNSRILWLSAVSKWNKKNRNQRKSSAHFLRQQCCQICAAFPLVTFKQDALFYSWVRRNNFDHCLKYCF